MSEQSAHAQRPPAPQESRSDARLIADLRHGEVDAYEELWLRHIGPALRMARRLAPNHAEDLAAEAFATVLHQITVVGGGPEQSFRAYLFTVMRNLAIRWNQEGRRLLPISVLDDPAVEDGADHVLADEDARIVLRALRSLPARWQQVLWLTEVDDMPRPAIAAQFDMSPNSVSALLRRARHGLRHRCLTEYVPESLREDRGHVARVLPDLVTGKLSPDVAAKVTSHLATCDTCREVYRELRGLSRRVKRATLGTLGFGALIFLAKDLSAVGATTTATTALTAGTSGPVAVGGSLSAAVKVASVAAGLIVFAGAVAGSLLSSSDSAPAAAAAPSASAAPSPSTVPPPSAVPSPPVSGHNPTPVVSQTAPPAGPSTPATPDPSATRPLTGGDIQVIDLERPTGTGSAPKPARVKPSPVGPHSIPGPATPSSPSSPATAAPSDEATTTPAPTPSESPSFRPDPNDPIPAGPVPIGDVPLLPPTVNSSGTGAGYFAPVLSGTAVPGAVVAIQVASTTSGGSGEIYTVTADPRGAWRFDLSDLRLPAGDYRASVWQVLLPARSTPVMIGFQVTPLRVDGLLPERTMNQIEAELDGIVITITAPGQQRACLSASTGQQASIPLGTNGTAERRIRFVGIGTFDVSVAVCEGQRRGAPTRGSVTVYTDAHDPWIELDPGIIVEEP